MVDAQSAGGADRAVDRGDRRADPDDPVVQECANSLADSDLQTADGSAGGGDQQQRLVCRVIDAVGTICRLDVGKRVGDGDPPSGDHRTDVAADGRRQGGGAGESRGCVDDDRLCHGDGLRRDRGFDVRNQLGRGRPGALQGGDQAPGLGLQAGRSGAGQRGERGDGAVG